jgi:DNA-binding transcriptional LysR family regulator
LRASGLQVRPEREFDNIETVKRTVEIDGAVSILPETALGNERRAGSLIPVEISSPALWRPVGVITRRNRAGSPALRCFIDFLRSSPRRPGLAKAGVLAD